MSEREEDDNSIFELLPLLDADHNHPQDWLFSSRMIHIVHDRMKYLCDGNAKDFGFAPDVHSLPSLDHVLLDMSSYECDELVTSSLDLLNQLYFFEEELFNKAQQSQLLTSNESLVDYRHVNNTILPELRQLLRVDANRDDQDKIIELLDRLSGMCLLSFSAGVGIKTNKHNQIMLDNFGLVSEIVTYVLAQGSHEQSTIGIV
jgi:inositol 1,4,5-triphosphate receptor type 1